MSNQSKPRAIRKPRPQTWGYADRKGGLTLEDNPYSYDDSLASARSAALWTEGWWEAEMEKNNG